LRTALLWFSALMVSGMLVFPRFTSTLLAGRLPRFLVAGAFRDFNEQTFISEFNAAADHQPIGLLLSPT
jgi:hypothetical protein